MKIMTRLMTVLLVLSILACASSPQVNQTDEEFREAEHAKRNKAFTERHDPVEIQQADEKPSYFEFPFLLGYSKSSIGQCESGWGRIGSDDADTMYTCTKYRHTDALFKGGSAGVKMKDGRVKALVTSVQIEADDMPAYLELLKKEIAAKRCKKVPNSHKESEIGKRSFTLICDALYTAVVSFDITPIVEYRPAEISYGFYKTEHQ